VLVPEQRGLVLQGHGLVSLLAAAENVTLPLQAAGRPRVRRGEVRRRATAALEEVRLDAVADTWSKRLTASTLGPCVPSEAGLPSAVHSTGRGGGPPLILDSSIGRAAGC
jgi:hypothetical protein